MVSDICQKYFVALFYNQKFTSLKKENATLVLGFLTFRQWITHIVILRVCLEILTQNYVSNFIFELPANEHCFHFYYIKHNKIVPASIQYVSAKGALNYKQLLENWFTRIKFQR